MIYKLSRISSFMLVWVCLTLNIKCLQCWPIIESCLFRSSCAYNYALFARGKCFICKFDSIDWTTGVLRVEIFKAHVMVFIVSALMTSHWLIIFSRSQLFDFDDITHNGIKGKMSKFTINKCINYPLDS